MSILNYVDALSLDKHSEHN